MTADFALGALIIHSKTSQGLKNTKWFLKINFSEIDWGDS